MGFRWFSSRFEFMKSRLEPGVEHLESPLDPPWHLVISAGEPGTDLLWRTIFRIWTLEILGKSWQLGSQKSMECDQIYLNHPKSYAPCMVKIDSEREIHHVLTVLQHNMI